MSFLLEIFINPFLPLKKEQQKIANFLFSIDVKIESTNQQITQRRALKRLVQQLCVKYG
jgi:restriction endonuclease S subunit